ncbi:MAG: TlpA family protein disulfide reductase [Streptosporangiaceae bacterium]
MISPHRSARRAAVATAISGLLAVAGVLGVTACSGGPIAESTAASNGQSFVGGSYSSTYYAPANRPAAPEVSGTMLTGGTFSMAAQRGNIVVLNFWGSWCAPCRREAPTLAALARHFKDAPVRFIGDDVQDAPANAAAFERTFDVGYPSLNDPGEQVALAFHGAVPPVGIPTTLLIDRSGHIAGRVVGEVTYQGLRALITKILAGHS